MKIWNVSMPISSWRSRRAYHRRSHDYEEACQMSNVHDLMAVWPSIDAKMAMIRSAKFIDEIFK